MLAENFPPWLRNVSIASFYFAKESVNEILAKSYYTTFYSFKGKRQVLDPDPKLPRSPPRPIKARGIWTPVNLHFTFALKMPYEFFQI